MNSVYEILNLKKLKTLAELRLILKPYKQKICFRIDDNLFETALNYIEKLKNDDTGYIPDIPDLGYCGIVVEDQSFTRLYVNKENVVLSKNKLTEIFNDSQKKIHNLLMKEVLTKYYKEIIYYCETAKYKGN